MKTNRSSDAKRPRTHEGGKANRIKPEEQLRRTVSACLLWEKSFYESGASIADRITESANACKPEFVAQLAVEVRNKHGIRHAPLWLILSLFTRKDIGEKRAFLGEAVANVIRRADEPAELIAMWWELSGTKKLPIQLKRGIAAAFLKFDAYQLGKYKGNGNAVTLIDAIRLTHPKAADKKGNKLLKKANKGTLPIPNTWETRMSAGENGKDVFTDLLTKGKLGYLALLRNLRKMAELGVDEDLICEALLARKGAGLILPHQFIAAGLHAVRFVPILDQAMQACLNDEIVPLGGKTAILVDVSGSMSAPLSQRGIAYKSADTHELSRLHAAGGLSIHALKASFKARIFAFGSSCEEVTPAYGMAQIQVLNEAMQRLGSQTNAGSAVKFVVSKMPDFDRIILIGDEQSADILPDVKCGYSLNVAAEKNGIGYRGGWHHVDGFSAQTIRYIAERESRNA